MLYRPFFMFLASALPAVAAPLDPKVGVPIFGGSGALEILNEFELGGNFPAPGTVVTFSMKAPVTVSQGADFALGRDLAVGVTTGLLDDEPAGSDFAISLGGVPLYDAFDFEEGAVFSRMCSRTRR